MSKEEVRLMVPEVLICWDFGLSTLYTGELGLRLSGASHRINSRRNLVLKVNENAVGEGQEGTFRTTAWPL